LSSLFVLFAGADDNLILCDWVLLLLLLLVLLLLLLRQVQA
jgi:hypothetical protein